MSDKLTQDMADKTDGLPTPQEGAPDASRMAAERPHPGDVAVVTVGTEDAPLSDDYAAIRAATLAMSGASDEKPTPVETDETPDMRDPAEPAGDVRDQETRTEATDVPPAIHDASPDVLAAQAAEVAPDAQADTSADEPADDASGKERTPLATDPAVPATGGGGGDQPPAQPPTEEEEAPDPDEKPMGLLDHLNEMRWRLVRCLIAAAVGFCVCWAFVEPIFAVLVKPLLAVLPAGGNAMYSTMPEAFFIRMFVACIAGVFVASPVIFYQIWAFISPGLYEEEKLFFVPVAVISAVFFVGGALFCYHIVFPFAFQFFMSYNTEQIRVMPRISDYVDFVLKLLIAFGLIFEMPLFAFFLSRMGLLTAAMMRQARRYAILGIFIVAAILTPPDVLSQLLMALPMLVLYEVSVIVAAVFGKKKKTAAVADSDGDETAPQEDGQSTGGQA